MKLCSEHFTLSQIERLEIIEREENNRRERGRTHLKKSEEEVRI